LTPLFIFIPSFMLLSGLVRLERVVGKFQRAREPRAFSGGLDAHG